jgi:hypothetical protein
VAPLLPPRVSSALMAAMESAAMNVPPDCGRTWGDKSYLSTLDAVWLLVNTRTRLRRRRGGGCSTRRSALNFH